MHRSAVHLLLVEDDRDVRETVAEVLGEAGFQVDVATDGTTALERLTRAPHIDVIVLDLMMPGMDGIAFRRAQLARPDLAEIPVVVCTASYLSPQLRAELQNGCTILRKPFDLETLLHEIHRCTTGAA